MTSLAMTIQGHPTLSQPVILGRSLWFFGRDRFLHATRRGRFRRGQTHLNLELL